MTNAPQTDTWRLLAHPLRSRILAHLRLHGGTTAAELARALGTNTGATSYHARVLAQAGLVVDTELGDGRSRVWAAAEEDDAHRVDTSVAVSAIDDADDLADALWLAHDLVDRLGQRVGVGGGIGHRSGLSSVVVGDGGVCLLYTSDAADE